MISLLLTWANMQQTVEFETTWCTCNICAMLANIYVDFSIAYLLAF